MSTALLKFKPQSMPKAIPFDPGILAAATDASPEPVAVTENGKLIYANRSFAQLSAKPDAMSLTPQRRQAMSAGKARILRSRHVHSR